MSFRLLLCATVVSGCAHVRPFPLAEVMWEDSGDLQPFGPRPEEYYSPFAWDGADQMMFRPIARFFAVDPAGESVNVNAMDEVPDSSWYENRLSRHSLTSEQIARAACTEHNIDPAGPWTIVAAKPNGANPGFIIEDAEERRFLLKFDNKNEQPERATAADVIGSILYWAAGYHTPCNRIVYFDRDILQIGEGVMVDVLGEEVPLTWEQLEPVFEVGLALEDGRFRAAASRFLPGRPIGPWRYESTRDEDPNDVVPHQDRRELRGAMVIAAWINHFDAREQNTLSIWRDTGDDQGYVEHYYIDFGETFGSLWAAEGISRRLGYSSYFDMRHVFGDLFTFGLLDRPWNHARYGASGKILGYFDAHRFEPDSWHPGYPNPAFLRASEHDKAWMTRIIARFSADDIRAAVAEGRFQNEVVRRQLYRVVMQRRQKILERYFRELSALTDPRVVQGKLCLQDLGITAGLAVPDQRPYYTQSWSLQDGEIAELPAGAMVRRSPDRICVTLPQLDTSDGTAKYMLVDVAGLVDGLDEDSMPARTHLYQLPDGGYRIVGLQRPDSRRPPQ